jgi:hypothetical protein
MPLPRGHCRDFDQVEALVLAYLAHDQKEVGFADTANLRRR